MAKVNENYEKLTAGYLFPEIARRTAKFREGNPGAKIIRLGIGDVTRPLTPSVVRAFRAAVEEMGTADGFRGYGPEQGCEFLREKIAKHDFGSRGVAIDPSEVFVSDGSKCDTGNIQEIFSSENVIAIQDPAYPVYVDTNVMAGRTGPADSAGRYAGLRYLPATVENGFAALPPGEHVDIIYLCSPNNPTGAVMSRDTLAKWVAYAKMHRSVILFDAAYEAYITEPGLPHSIFEIDGARDVAIEFRSFSKNAGFTGTRCAYTVVPHSLKAGSPDGEVSLNALWNRRHCTKFNGVSYPVQRAAEAVYSDEGRREVAELIAYYMNNAKIIREGWTAIGVEAYGGDNAPYIWLRVPGGLTSWAFFDKLLSEANVVGTPGSGFGPSGEGYFRLSAFGNTGDVEEAMARIRTRLKL